MQLLTKAGLGLALLFAMSALAPAAKADPLLIQTSGFSPSNPGSNGGGNSGFDSPVGASRLIALLNPLTFTPGFTGNGSGGQTYLSNLSQLLTMNGPAQTLKIAGAIDSQLVDSIHIISSPPLTFNFGTFSVDVRVLPAGIDGWAPGVFSDMLKAEFTVTSECAGLVPEPAALTLIGLGLATVAAKLRQRRKRHAL
jgi:PEP-CTERM motif